MTEKEAFLKPAEERRRDCHSLIPLGILNFHPRLAILEKNRDERLFEMLLVLNNPPGGALMFRRALQMRRACCCQLCGTLICIFIDVYRIHSA